MRVEREEAQRWSACERVRREREDALEGGGEGNLRAEPLHQSEQLLRAMREDERSACSATSECRASYKRKGDGRETRRLTKALRSDSAMSE
jgi:hypothetical protein